MRFGVGIMGEFAASAFAQYVRGIEDLGYDYVWIADERFWRDPYVAMTVCALNTRKVVIGTAVTNPYTRFPAVTAAAMATVDEVADGRTVLGIAAGGSNHRMLGIKRERPALAVREAVNVFRRLVAGEKFSFNGTLVKVYDAKLDFTPVRPRIPVYIAARGPSMLELAGEIADGVIIGGFSSEEGIKYALDHVRRGAAKAGRSLDNIDVVSWLYTSVSDDDPASAKKAVSQLVIVSIINSRPILGEMGLELPEELRAALDKNDWKQDHEYISKYLSLLPEDLINKFSVSGTVDNCALTIRRIAELGVNQLAILPFATKEHTKQDIVNIFKTKVVPKAFPDLQTC
ncbi:MAG TPA: LLM class flavin-dependent oxidoreductase [Firmicutes bacterium]|nr:LLM class flavin-dependent oxidoreductase [Bacillota bacterium]